MTIVLYFTLHSSKVTFVSNIQPMDEDLQQDSDPTDEMETDELIVSTPPQKQDLDEVGFRPASSSDQFQQARELVTAATWELEAAQDEKKKASIHFSLGLIIEHRLSDSRRAIEHYLEAWRLEPRHLAAIQAARRLFRGRHNWTMVLELLEAEITLTTAPAHLAELLLQQGRVFEEWLASSEKAKELYLEALKHDPGNRKLLFRLRQLFWRQQDHQGILDLCKRAAATTQDRQYRGVLLGEMGRVFEDGLSDDESAITAYSAAFVEDPTLTAIRAALKRLYLRHGRWGDLVDVLLTEGDLIQGIREQAEVLFSAARVCRDQLGQLERALELFSDALKRCPGSPAVLQEVAELLENVGRYERLAEVYLDILAHQQEKIERVVVHYRLARLLEDRLGQEDQAIRHYRHALELDATYIPALQALGRLYQRRGMWTELVEMSIADAEAVMDIGVRVSRFCGLADLCEVQLKDLPRAIAFHRRALAEHPRYLPSRRALERLLTMTGDWDALIDFLDGQLEGQAGAAMGLQLTRIGQLCEQRSGQRERAITYYERALEQCPGDVVLLQALQRLYTEGDRYDDLVRLIDLEIAETESEELLLALQHRAAEITELRLDNEADAIKRYREILARSPVYGPTLNVLGRIHTRRGEWAEVIALYRMELSHGQVDAERRGAVLYKIGELYQENLGDEDAALEAYREAIDASPRVLPVLQALARLYRQRDLWEELIAVMQSQAELTSDANQRSSTLYSIGEIYETRLDRRDQAIQHYQEALALWSNNELCGAALLRIFSADKRWREVAEILEKTLAAANADSTRFSIHKRLGEIWNRYLQNSPQAIEHYEHALAIVAEDLEALEALRRLYQRTGQHEALVDVTERLALRAQDTHEAIGYLYEAARVIEAHLPEFSAYALYARIIERSPTEIFAAEALSSIPGESIDPLLQMKNLETRLSFEQDSQVQSALWVQLAQAREVQGDSRGAERAYRESAALVEDWATIHELRRLQEELELWPDAARSLEREAELSGNQDAVMKSFLKAASIYQDRFGDIAKAAQLLIRVLDVDPYHEEAAARLEQLLVPREAWQELVDVLERRLEAATTGARPASGDAIQAQIELITRMAWIEREHLQKAEAAITTLQRSTQLDPNHLPTLQTLGELHLALEQWRESIDIYSRIVMVSDDAQVLRSAHFQLGELWSTKVGDVRQAISSYQNVMAIAPDETVALTKLYQLFVQDKDWENAADTIARSIEVEGDPEVLVGHLVSLADIQEKGFGNPELAVEQLRRALEIDPLQSDVLDRLIELYANLSDWEALCAAIGAFLAALPVERQGRGIAYRQTFGEVLNKQLGQPAAALEQYQAIIEVDPSNVEARLATAAILVGERRFDEAIAEHKEIQGLDMLNLQSLDQMRAIWASQGMHELSYAAEAVLVCVGEGHAVEQSYREHRARGTRLPKVPLDPEAYEAVLVHPGESRVGSNVLAVLGEVAHRIRPPRLSDWGVGKADRLSPRSDDPLKEIVREVGTLLGIEREVEIYSSQTRPREIDLLCTDPPALVAGVGLMNAFSSMEIRFQVGRLLSVIRNRAWIAHDLSGAELGALIRAACAAVEIPLPGGSESRDQLLESARLIQRSHSRRGRRTLEEACRALTSSQELDPTPWVQGMRSTALRSGLWVVNDFETAFNYLKQTEPGLSQADVSTLVSQTRRSELATELVHFWLSEEYLSLQRAAEF